MRNKKKWAPDKIANTLANNIASELSRYNGEEANGRDTSHFLTILYRPQFNDYKLEVYVGNKAPPEKMEQFFNLTRSNMKHLYDGSNFMGGWDDGLKLKELKHYKTHLIGIYKNSQDLLQSERINPQLVYVTFTNCKWRKKVTDGVSGS
ncbi:hypothetical protein BdWA1_002569 [Babesia duncani]|uniref:Uncharacterized protein n=1 Tax=Babesia duncani TaxID=323732 RepID=A0AAD9UNL5_9APIC|nr:hypothetical protein BdWA1_002569 [Babesia duncani]